MLVGADRGVEGGGADALVFGQQVVGKLVEVGDAADHRRARDQLIAVRGQLGQQLRVFRVALDELVAGVVVEAALDRAVFAEVVNADDLVPGLQEVGDEISADEPGGAGDEDLQSRIGPVMPQMSTTSRPVRSSFL